MRVSVIIPTKTVKGLSSCISSIMCQRYKNFEVIIVYDGVSSSEILNEIDSNDIMVVPGKGTTLGAARNVGISKAEGEIVAFIDADAIANRNWLHNLVKNYNSLKVGGVGGSSYTINPNRRISHYQELGWIGWGYLAYGKHGITKRLSGCNMSFRKTVLEEVGMFNEQLISHEDTLICSEIIKNGYYLIYEPNAIVFHDHKSSLPQLTRVWMRDIYAFPLYIKLSQIRKSDVLIGELASLLRLPSKCHKANSYTNDTIFAYLYVPFIDILRVFFFVCCLFLISREYI